MKTRIYAAPAVKGLAKVHNIQLLWLLGSIEPILLHLVLLNYVVVVH